MIHLTNLSVFFQLQTTTMKSMFASFVAAGTRHAKACPVMLAPIFVRLESLRVRSRAALLIFFTRSWRMRTSSPSAQMNGRLSLQTVPIDPPLNAPRIYRLLPANDLNLPMTAPVFCAGRSLRIEKACPAMHALTCVRLGCLTFWGKALLLTLSRSWSAVA